MQQVAACQDVVSLIYGIKCSVCSATPHLIKHAAQVLRPPSRNSSSTEDALGLLTASGMRSFMVGPVLHQTEYISAEKQQNNPTGLVILGRPLVHPNRHTSFFCRSVDPNLGWRGEPGSGKPWLSHEGTEDVSYLCQGVLLTRLYPAVQQ